MPKRRTRATLPRPSEVRSPEDALAVILAADCGDPLVALVLTADRRCGVVMTVADAHDESVESVVEAIADAAPPGAALVLASMRAGRGIDVSMDDVYRWFNLRAAGEEREVDVLDWFLVDGTLARSMAEATFSEGDW